ncbi:LrgB family protein [Acholeplasma hippikon]|uniref:Inner membrane protein yohK n=1 Tax=Acholeplasma hippikon TaxID=264636 RepID=A0A449BK03_9MOLU|nr:LrgB family protein [Acholeplasma hippikon]VEU82778.1 Inner membrane protein yohK [Acholeplasma hippikon]
MSTLIWALPLTIGVYITFLYIQNRTKIALLNPLLLTSVTIIIVLLMGNIDYKDYEVGSSVITYLIGPATVSLAIPLYEKLGMLKKHWKVVTVSILSGVFAHALCIILITFILKSTPEMVATFIPKSVTTAIAKDISLSLGGNVSLTVVIVVLTGVLGAVLAPNMFKIFGIKEPIARGLALGSAAHAVGTSKALEFGDLDASMATLSLIITGIITVITAPFIYDLILLLIK